MRERLLTALRRREPARGLTDPGGKPTGIATLASNPVKDSPGFRGVTRTFVRRFETPSGTGPNPLAPDGMAPRGRRPRALPGGPEV